MRLPIPGGTAGGGGLGLVIIIFFVVLTQCMGSGQTTAGPDSTIDTSRVSAGDEGRYSSCKYGADANTNPDCERIGVENSLYDFWDTTLPEQAGTAFRPAALRTFSGSVGTGCGAASSQVGPFYCPRDETIYMDTAVLRRRSGASAGRSGRRLRPGLRAGTRIRSPHPEPPRHDGPGSHTAGSPQRCGPARTASRLLRRHVGQRRHQRRRTPTARC